MVSLNNEKYNKKLNKVARGTYNIAGDEFPIIRNSFIRDTDTTAYCKYDKSIKLPEYIPWALPIEAKQFVNFQSYPKGLKSAECKFETLQEAIETLIEGVAQDHADLNKPGSDNTEGGKYDTVRYIMYFPNRTTKKKYEYRSGFTGSVEGTAHDAPHQSEGGLKMNKNCIAFTFDRYLLERIAESYLIEWIADYYYDTEEGEEIHSGYLYDIMPDYNDDFDEIVRPELCIDPAFNSFKK